MLPFLRPLFFSPPLVNSYPLIFSLVVRGSQPLSPLLFLLVFLPPFLYHLPLISPPPLLCRFISGLKLDALCLMARPVHFLRLRFLSLLFHLPIYLLIIFLLQSAKVNVLALNILLLISFLMIASLLVFTLLFVAYLVFSFPAPISRLCPSLVGNMQWMGKCVPFIRIKRGKLIYLIVTCPDITYAVGVVSQFMHAPRQSHFAVMCCILHYLKSAPSGVCSIVHLPHCLSLASVMLIGLVIRLTAIPPWAIVPLLVEILLLGVARNKLLLLVLALKLNTVPWLILLLRCSGFNLVFRDFGFFIPASMSMSCDN
ncbi:uncharacterized protein LOC114316087 [Camellia sinensis]|uniref:uncharacterized protein LOC114316087 n=1 Tax=Camellia sinensis TaxID=4442 RepID=UPI0010357F1E|nr:uncharacterized protein LOC114316087 [Camellia sinensis]